MTAGRRFRELKPRVRFAQKAAAPGGIGVDQAVRGAEARLAPLMDRVAAQVLQLVDEMLAAGGGPARQPLDVAGLRGRADAVVGLSAAVGLPEFQSVASSLCRLIDNAAGEALNPAALTVHLDALRLFRDSSPEVRAQVAPSVLEGLRRLASFRGRTAAAA